MDIHFGSSSKNNLHKLIMHIWMLSYQEVEHGDILEWLAEVVLLEEVCCRGEF